MICVSKLSKGFLLMSKIMTEEIQLEDLSKGTDDDNDDEDEDGTFYQSPNTSTTFEQDYAGYDEYSRQKGEERGRAEWDKQAEGRRSDNFRDEEYDRMREARQKLKRYYPNYNPNDSPFNVRFGENGSIEGKLSIAGNNVWHTLVDENGVRNTENLPKTFRKALGADYESMLEKYNNTASKLKKSIEENMELDNALQGLKATAEVYPQEINQYVEREKELREFIERQQLEKAEALSAAKQDKSLFDQAVKQNIELKIQAEKLLDETKLYKEEIDKYKKGKSNLTKLEQSNERLKSEVDKLREQIRNKTISSKEQISNIDGRKDEILKNLPLRERLKYIFKKYGFTVFAVVSAVGIIIGVIVSNLSKGLSTLGRGVGNGLKTLGKKLGEILPGMVGAIVSFLFKTAGQVIGFLGENAWLLIMAVVIYFVEQMKSGNKRK